MMSDLVEIEAEAVIEKVPLLQCTPDRRAG